MKQLRRLVTVTLQYGTKTKQSNGAVITTYSDIQDYRVIVQDVSDSVSATVYGSRITNMLRLLSPREELEELMMSKSNETSDNISKYFILIDDRRYKVVSASQKGVDVEFYETDRTV